MIRFTIILIAGTLITGCLHKVIVPKQGEIPAPVIGHSVCIDPTDPTGQKIVPCLGGK